MYDNYNYPYGADTPSAPWNQPSTPIKTFPCEITQVLTKKVDISTDDYYMTQDEEDGSVDYHTENTNWEEAYANDDHFSIKELLDKLKEYVEEDLQGCPKKGSMRRAKLNHLLKEIEGWTCEETTIEY